MKKLLRATSCFLCCLLTVLMLCSCRTSAESNNNETEIQKTTNLLGDADGDGDITIIDATTVQRHLAQLFTLNESAQKRADVNNSGEVDITDATFIQRFLASLNVPYRVGQPLNDSTVDFERFTKDTKITDLMNDEAFGNFGRLLFPADRGYYSGMTLDNLSLTWYGHPDTDKSVEIVNYLKEQALTGNQIFYDIYTDEEKAADPDKNDTGLFFFKGEENKPFAICNAGGGMVFVGSMQDSFPHALELSKKGYNAFALIYRPGYRSSVEDLSRAIAFIFEHAEELGVSTDDYSLWGGSAGARMAAWVGANGTESYGEKAYPQPAAVIMQYTGLTEVTGNEPPTYNCVGTNDGIASWRTMQNRINAIKANGTDTMIEIFDGLPHGFGLGIGTVADGWLDNATAFWERNMTKKHTLSGTIPAEIELIPDSYMELAEHQGRLEKLTYDTWESFTYEQHSQKLSKEAWVYVPYGYDASKKYNIMYLSHGGWSNETTIMGTANNPAEFKHIIDHAIEDGKMQPMILVMMTYNNTSPQDSSNSVALDLVDQYHNELINDLIPAAESKYSTYAKDMTPEGLIASRDHRGFGGFSMGSVNTWHTFQYCLDYFRYFMPMSGSLTNNGSYMASLVTDQGYSADDFFIFAMSGPDDFAYSGFKRQIEAMAQNEMFTLGDNEEEGNLAYREMDGFPHGREASNLYTYNGLMFFWNSP